MLWSICTMLAALPVRAQQGFGFRPNPHGHWYFLTPTGFAAQPKKVVFQDGLLAVWQYQKTTRNGNSVALGLIPTLLAGEQYMPVWVSAHKRMPVGGTRRQPAFTVNAGGFFLSLPNGATSENDQDLSLFYLNTTFGSREKNFAIGGAIVPTGFGDGIYPQAITLHGLTRLGRRSCLITENYFIHDRGQWIPCSMTGWRRWKRRTAFDAAVLVVRVPGEAEAGRKRIWAAIPWLSVHHILRHDILSPPPDDP
jgi:hypothetical protein